MKKGVGFRVCSLAAVLFVLSVFYFGSELPDRVATHFDNAGRVNGWMSRSDHLISFTMVGLGVSLFIIVLTALTRFLPASMLNVPHADYWRSKEHYPEACDYLHQHSYWFATMLLIWFGALHILVVLANRQTPPAMDTNALWILLPGLVIAILIWTVALMRHFYKKGAPEN